MNTMNATAVSLHRAKARNSRPPLKPVGLLQIDALDTAARCHKTFLFGSALCPHFLVNGGKMGVSAGAAFAAALVAQQASQEPYQL
jgi:hypothetical protein